MKTIDIQKLNFKIKILDKWYPNIYKILYHDVETSRGTYTELYHHIILRKTT